MKMYDVVSGRKVVGQEKKRWTNVGVAFEGDDGKISGIKLNALPHKMRMAKYGCRYLSKSLKSLAPSITRQRKTLMRI